MREPGPAGWPSPRAALLTALLLLAQTTIAQDRQALRISIASNVFRSLLQADVDLARKAEGKQLYVAFLHRSSSGRAAEIAKSFEGTTVGRQGLTIQALLTSDLTLKSLGHAPAAVFLTEPLSKEMRQAVVRYGIERHVIVYSPFDGDVERGVLGGVSIEAQVKPFINGATLDASRITLKPHFLELAKVHR